MLREDKSAAFAGEGMWFWRRFRFRAGSRWSDRAWTPAAVRALMESQHHEPVLVLEAGDRRHWAYAGRFWWEDEGLEAADVAALVWDRDERRRRKLERARAAFENRGAGARREPIPRTLRHAVFSRDDGRCVECGAAFDLQYDHVIPVALGGATTAANLQLLCAPCNRRKGATLG